MLREGDDPKKWSTRISPFFRLSAKDKIIFFKYLAVMTEAGIPLERALIAIHNQSNSTVLHRVLHVMLNDTASGEFLSTSLKKMPHLFDMLLTNLITVGETSGTLTSALFRISEHLEKTKELRSKIRSAFLYPSIVITGTLLTTAYMLFVLLPQLLPLFSSLNVELPWITKMVIAVSSFLLANGLWIFLTVVAVVIVFLLLTRIEKVHYAVDFLILRIPLVGVMIRKVQVTLFSRILSTLLMSGTSIVEAFTIASTSLNNRVYRKALSIIGSTIQEGESISSYLAKHSDLFSPLVTQMVSVGEETGKLDESFDFVAKFTEKELDDATKTLTTVLEPLLMVFIGALVGVVAIAIITPIYSLTQGLQR
jgi:type IV pilus assembly protein PilC